MIKVQRKYNEQWQEIKSNGLSMTPTDNVKAHNALINNLIGLMGHVADNSEITLDPALDSYYLGDALVNRLPNLTENMGQARAIGSSAAAAGKIAPAVFTKLAVLFTAIISNIPSLYNVPMIVDSIPDCCRRFYDSHV